MADTVSPEATVCVPEAAAAGAAAGAAAPVGIVSCWPSRMEARESRPLALRTAATVLPCRAAMWLTVSPARTVYCSSACATPPVAVTATAAMAMAPVPVARRRPRRPGVREGAPSWRSAWSVRARAGCVMVGTPVLRARRAAVLRVTCVTGVTGVTSATVVHPAGAGKPAGDLSV